MQKNDELIVSGRKSAHNSDLKKKADVSSECLDTESLSDPVGIAQIYLKKIFDSLGEGIFIADLDGQIIDVNRSLLVMFGYEQSELVGQSLQFLLGVSGMPGFSQHLQMQARRKDGRQFPIDLSLSDLRGAGIRQLVGVVRDAQQRTDELEKLAESEELFRDFAESAADWLWETDDQHRYTRLVGPSPMVSVLVRQGVIGKTRRDLMRGNVSPEAIKEHFDSLNAHKPFRDFCYKSQMADGQLRSFAVSGKPRFDAMGTFLGFRGTARDITEQVEAKERLTQLETQLVDAISSLAEGFILFDADDRVVISNKQYSEGIFGLKPDLVQPGVPYAELIRQYAFSGGYDITGEAREQWLAARIDAHKRADGTPYDQLLADGRWIRSTEYATRDGGVVGLHTDVTQWVTLHRELQRASREAEEANRAKSEFLATMSHEIRTPMNGIIGMLDLLREEGMTGEQRCFVETARGSAETLLSLINNVLDFSKMEAGRLDLEEHPFDVESLMSGVLGLLTLAGTPDGVVISQDVAPEAQGIFMGDSGCLRQVLLNLVGNAFKFTKKGRIAIFADLVNATADGGILSFTVADTGVGIPDTAKDFMFEKFRQADSSTRRQFGGTGLGLAISKRIVEIMGGSIGFESQEGQGTTFWFRVPVKRWDDSETAALCQMSVGEVPLVSGNGI